MDVHHELLQPEFGMSTVIQISDELRARLAQLAEKTGRPADEHARQALLDYLDEQEDYWIAAGRLKKRNLRVPFEELEKELGLEH